MSKRGVFLGALVGALSGVLFTTFGLVDFTGRFEFVGGNEYTWAVITAGVVFGIVLGILAERRRYLAVLVAMDVALIGAMWLRDRNFLQPPLVFLDLFGLPLLAAAAAWWLVTRRRSATS